PRGDGPARGRQPAGLGIGQAAADAGRRDAVAAEEKMSHPMPRIGIAALALSLLASGPAFAQATLGESAKEMIGSWEFSTADRQASCTATFKSDRAGKGFRVEFDDKCAAVYAQVKDIASWTFPDNDLLNLLDPAGKSLIEFSEVE